MFKDFRAASKFIALKNHDDYIEAELFGPGGRTSRRSQI